MEMKEMIYSGNQISELLYTDGDEEYKYAILNIRGSHPCAYVQFPGVEKLESYDDMVMNKIDPHGYFTYLGTLNYPELPGIWLGWDYAHFGDYTAIPSMFPDFGARFGRKYTTKEIADECKSILQQIMAGEYEIIADEDDDYEYNED